MTPEMAPMMRVPIQGVLQIGCTIAQTGPSMPSLPIENAVRTLGSSVVCSVATVDERNARMASDPHCCPTSLSANAVSVAEELSAISLGVSTCWMEMAASKN